MDIVNREYKLELSFKEKASAFFLMIKYLFTSRYQFFYNKKLELKQRQECLKGNHEFLKPYNKVPYKDANGARSQWRHCIHCECIRSYWIK